MMTREEAKQMFRDDKNSQGCYRAVLTKIDKIYDAFDEQIAELREALTGSKLQIEYLHEKFKETGSGNAVLNRINQTLKTTK